MLFTVITVTYNSAAFIRQTIESVLAQQYADFELLIGDDLSTDDTWKIVEEYKDPRIKKYRNEVNLGEYRNRAKAVREATGKYILFLDGDDVMYDHALLTFARYTGSFPESAMFFCREWDPRILCPYKADPATIYRFEYLDKGIIGGNFTNVLFNAGILKEYIFPDGIRSGDTYIQLKIGQSYPGVVIPDGLTWWRRRDGNATQRLFSDFRHLAESLNYRSALLGDGCPLSHEENEQARVNIYGVHLRIVFRLLLAGRFSDVFYLLRHAKVPGKYYLAVFRRSKQNYYAGITGDRPLQTDSGFNTVTNNMQK
jgi:glycosyltransferase involved in cell wall biosynthesis